MYFVNVVSMKIPIIIFICISIPSAWSTGSNSSLFESKKIPTEKKFGANGLQFIGHIVRGIHLEKRVGTTTFINECNCLTTKGWAMIIDENKFIHRVESPVFLQQDRYYIKSVLYNNADNDVAAYWGVLKLQKECVRDNPYFSLINSRLPEFGMKKKYYVGGWIFRSSGKVIPRYSQLQLLPFRFCKDVFNATYGSVKHNLACASLKEGEFKQADKGTGLFLDHNQLLGIAVEVTLDGREHTICALLHNDEKRILEFIKNEAEASRSRDDVRDKGKGKGKAPAEARNVYKHTGAYDQGQIDRHGLNLNLHPMGTDHQDNMGAYDPRLLTDWNQEAMAPYIPNPMGTYHQDNTGAYDSSFLAAWNQEQMGALNPIHVHTHHQGQTGTHDTSLVGTHGHGQMDPRHQSEIFQLPKPIKTRSNQSPRAERFHGGSHTARADLSGYQNPDVQGQRAILDTFRLNRKYKKKTGSRE